MNFDATTWPKKDPHINAIVPPINIISATGDIVNNSNHDPPNAIISNVPPQTPENRADGCSVSFSVKCKVNESARMEMATK